MPSTALQITIEPQPSATNTFDQPPVRECIRDVLTLNGISALFKVTLTQTQQSPNDVHQFQVFFEDGRVWIDALEFVPPHENLTSPSLTRESEGDQFTYAEWQAILDLRVDILAMHNSLAEPDLIDFTLGTTNTEVILNVTPLTGTAGVGTLLVDWISPLVGHLDYIALYLVGAPNNDYLTYQYVPDGEQTGNFTFAMPSSPGSYEFRYLVANSYVSVATSPTVVVS